MPGFREAEYLGNMGPSAAVALQSWFSSTVLPQWTKNTPVTPARGPIIPGFYAYRPKLELEVKA